MNDHYIGQPVIFCLDPNQPAELGTIINIQETPTGPLYTVRRPAEPGEPSVDGWAYYSITDAQNINLSHEKSKPFRDKWAIEHQKEINEAFGVEFDDYACLIVYDNLNQMIDHGFGAYIRDNTLCRPVLDKWVFWVV